MAQTAKTPPQEGDQPKRFIERIFKLEQEWIGKAIEFAPQLQWLEPDAQAGLHEREEDELDERPIEAAVERPGPKWIGIDPRYRR